MASFASALRRPPPPPPPRRPQMPLPRPRPPPRPHFNRGVAFSVIRLPYSMVMVLQWDPKQKCFVIHGLWPDCPRGLPKTTTEIFLAERHITNPLRADMIRYWPNLKLNLRRGRNHDYFWQAQWNKHGSRSGLSALVYFDLAIRFYKWLCNTRVGEPPLKFRLQANTVYAKGLMPRLLKRSVGNVVKVDCGGFINGDHVVEELKIRLDRDCCLLDAWWRADQRSMILRI